MKKLFMFPAIVIALMFSLVSCEKEEMEIMEEEIEIMEEEVRIFISGTNISNSKSSSTTGQEAQDGDTISISRDVNVLMYAENLNGQPYSAEWHIAMSDSDYPDGFYSDPFSSHGDQILYKFNDNGIYLIRLFSASGILIKKFYVSVTGLPGKIGDEIFRLEKKNLYDPETGQSKKFLFAYYKYRGDINGFVDSDQTYAFLTRCNGGNSEFTVTEKLEKYKYCEGNYYYFILEEEDYVEFYKVYFFWSTDPNNGGCIDENQYYSNLFDLKTHSIKFTW
ncbi:MAG: hypothetical protein WC146_00045 [Patescibacteria group bacterium]|jgi:hypothetical protein